MQLLLARGANPRAKDCGGVKPHEMAEDAGLRALLKPLSGERSQARGRTSADTRHPAAGPQCYRLATGWLAAGTAASASCS